MVLDRFRNVVNQCSGLLRGRVGRNLTALYVAQILNYLIPLLLIPYLVRVLGPEGFGSYALVQVFTQYLVLLTDYGFNFSATRQIAVAREDADNISHIFSNVIAAKLVLWLLSLIVTFAVLAWIPQFRERATIVWAFHGMVLGSVLTPTWYFQGVERMGWMTLINAVGRACSVALMFVLVRSAEDLVWVGWANTAGTLITGSWSIGLVLATFRVRVVRPSIGSMWQQINESTAMFVSSAAVSLYTLANTLLLGLLTTSTSVAYYNASDRFIRAAKGFISPVGQALYPRMAHLAEESREGTLQVARRALVVLGTFTLLMSLGLSVLAPWIVRVVLGPSFQAAVPVLQIMAWIPFFVGLSTVLGMQVMIPFRLDREFSSLLLVSGVLNLLMVVTLGYLFEHLGAAIAATATEGFVTIAMWVFLRRRGLNLITSWRKHGV